MDQTTSIIFFFAAIFIAGGILFAIISFSRHTPRQLKKDYYRSQWLTIESQLKKEDIHSYTVCIINADKLLDQALKERAVSGETMGERMKAFQSQWTNAQHIWAAHKIRNRIAHEAGVSLDYMQVRRALSAFRQGLKDVGAL